MDNHYFIIEGTVTACTAQQTGMGRIGPWSHNTYKLQYGANAFEYLYFSVWNENIKSFALHKDDRVRLTLSIEGREYNGRTYNNVTAGACEHLSAQQPQQQPAQQSYAQQPYAPAQQPYAQPAQQPDDVIPF